MAAAATGPGAATETAAPVRAPSSDETSSGVASNSPSNSHMLWRRRAARKPSLLLVSGHISRADREASPCITSIIVRAPHTVGVEVQGEINLSTHTQTGNRAPSGFDKALCPRHRSHRPAEAPAAAPLRPRARAGRDTTLTRHPRPGLRVGGGDCGTVIFSVDCAQCGGWVRRGVWPLGASQFPWGRL